MLNKLLLISNSKAFGRAYLDHCEDEIKDVLSGIERVLFVPYAQPGGITYGDYAQLARSRFHKMDFKLDSIHEFNNPRRAVEEAQSIFIGGGNTFLLLKTLYDSDVMETIRQKVTGGIPYIGASAGSNVACPTIMTTNDMPIVYPRSFVALNFVPFQINAHFLDPDPNSKHQGETREIRIMEFLKFNDTPVVGLREGAMLKIDWPKLSLRGKSGVRIFTKGREPVEYQPGSSLNFLLG